MAANIRQPASVATNHLRAISSHCIVSAIVSLSRLKRRDICHHIRDGVVVGKHIHHGSHLCTHGIASRCATLSGTEFFQLLDQVPVGLTYEFRRFQRFIAFTVCSVASSAGGVQALSAGNVSRVLCARLRGRSQRRHICGHCLQVIVPVYCLGHRPHLQPRYVVGMVPALTRKKFAELRFDVPLRQTTDDWRRTLPIPLPTLAMATTAKHIKLTATLERIGKRLGCTCECTKEEKNHW